ncbi:MAG: hypothetical protein JXB00_00655, partial [Bacteroidales bacterium]|nr:hypothetical protein [Bacteroidales bacterium]
DQEQMMLWQESLLNIQKSSKTNPLISGYITRLLTDKKIIGYAEAEIQLSFYMSVNNSPSDAAYWFEGFLKSSGTILLLDDQLWNLMNNWIESVADDNFIELLPVLRRTFSVFTQAERRKIGEKAKGASGFTRREVTNDDFDFDRAKKVIPVMHIMLGLKKDNEV